MPVPSAMPMGPSAVRSPMDEASVCPNPLPFRSELQQQDNWCWAAVTTCIDTYYRKVKQWTQCKLADLLHSQQNCCSQGSSPNCDRPANTGQALRNVGRLAWEIGFKAGLQDIQWEISHCRPVAVGIQWTDGTGHAVSVYGYDNIGNIYVADPDDASMYAVYPYRIYPAGGTWQRTYFTKP